MKSIPPIALMVMMAAATLGVLMGLYSLLTRGRRRTVGEIKSEAIRRGWAFHLRRWLGDPTAFRINGWSRSGLTWILKTGPNSSDHHGWTVGLGLHFARLGGEMDFAVVPRIEGVGTGVHTLRLSPNVQARLAAFSSAAANAAGFFRDAGEASGGLPAFDAAYKILVLEQRITQSPIDSALAQRILNWPVEAIVPKEVLAWREPFGVHLHAHLPGTPNWATITHFLAIAEDLCARLPAPVATSVPRSFWDRMLGRILEN
jgi:hypothetical protein